MEDEPSNNHPDCFWQADVDEAAERLGKILREEQADLITCYDDHGTYGTRTTSRCTEWEVRAAELEGVGVGLRGDCQPRPPSVFDG